MIIRIINARELQDQKLEFINTDHIILVNTKWVEEKIDGQWVRIPKGADIKLTHDVWLNLNQQDWEFIEHYLNLQYLKDSADVCGKLGIEETK